MAKLSDEERELYNRLDPFAATTDKPWEFEVTSRFLRKVALGWAVLVMAIHIFMACVVGVGYTGASITHWDQFAFVGIGVIITIVCTIGLLRPRVRANEDGVEVRNFLGTRFYVWSVIYGLSFPKGSRMARLELPEFEYVPMWAMQSADRGTIIDTVERFRALEARYMPTD